MGGIGSGRRNQSGKVTTDDYRRIDVRRWQRDGFLTPGNAFSWNWAALGKTVASIQVRAEADHVILYHRHMRADGDLQQMTYPVHLQWSDCTFGGRRVWFSCPARGCGRRVAILYYGHIFTCRHCHQLAYACQRETAGNRAMRRADTIRERLGWGAGIANPKGVKPKWMRWRTFEKLNANHDAFVSVSLAETIEWLDRVNKPFVGLRRGMNSEV